MRRNGAVVGLWFAVMLAACGDDGGARSPTASAGDDHGAQIAFADTALAAAVREAVGAAEGTRLTAAMVDTLTKLTARARGIEDLGGIGRLRRLAILDLADNRIAAIDSLAGLDSLAFLDLTGNRVEDLSPLAGLKRLAILQVAGNGVEEVTPLSGLAQLQSLDLTGNPLSEAALDQVAAMVARGVEVTYRTVSEEGDEPLPTEPFRPATYAFLGKARIGQRWNIWIGTTDGSPPHPLVDEPADFLHFDWSPDGSRMVFSSNREDAQKAWERTYVVNADGSGLAALSGFYPSGTHVDLAWSPDGTRIAYVAAPDMFCRCGAIEVMNADGTEVRTLTDPDGKDGPPAWSPDGRHLAFIRDPGGRVIVLDVETGEERQVAEDGSQWLGQEWSPAGDAVLYTGPEVMLVYVDDGRVLDLTANPATDYNPHWSPDGTRIAFISNRDLPVERSGGDVFVMDADGSNVTKVTPSDGLSYAPSWSPDGQAIAYVSDRSGIFSIHIVDPSGLYDLNATAGEPKIKGAPSFGVKVKWRPQ